MDLRPPERVDYYRLSIRNYQETTEWSIDDLRRIDGVTMGSLFYTINTGQLPFEEVEELEAVEQLYVQGIFPDTTEVLLGNLIRDIWLETTSEVGKICLRVAAGIPLPK